MSREESLQAGTRRHHLRGRHEHAGLWFSLAAGPVAWVIGLNLEYSLVLVACARGTMLWLHLVSLGTLLLALAGVLVGLREWRRSSGDTSAEALGKSLSLGQFMAALAVLGSGFFALVIVAQWMGSFILNPCMGI